MEISRDFLKALQNPSEARATRNARKEAEEKLRDAMHSAPGGNGFKFSVLKPKGGDVAAGEFNAFNHTLIVRDTGNDQYVWHIQQKLYSEDRKKVTGKQPIDSPSYPAASRNIGGRDFSATIGADDLPALLKNFVTQEEEMQAEWNRTYGFRLALSRTRSFLKQAAFAGLVMWTAPYVYKAVTDDGNTPEAPENRGGPNRREPVMETVPQGQPSRILEDGSIPESVPELAPGTT